MGTNYYIKAAAPCECCGRPFDDIHIGKMSGGWRFMFSTVIGRTLEEARAAINAADRVGIQDEHGQDVSAAALLELIDYSASGKSHLDYCRAIHPASVSHLHEDSGFTFIDTEFS